MESPPLGAGDRPCRRRGRVHHGQHRQDHHIEVAPDLVDAIKSDQILADIDQQGWLQGYGAVDSLWLYKINGNVLGSGRPVLTGPTW